MTEEVPLSEFVTEAEGDQQEVSESESVQADAGSGATPDQPTDAADRPVAPEDVTPIEPTSVYDPTGVLCDGCGKSVQRRFHTDGGLRCPECVSWNRDD